MTRPVSHRLAQRLARFFSRFLPAVLASMLVRAAHAEPVVESLGPGVVRVFADDAARKNAHPSYALLPEIHGLTGAGVQGPGVQPEFADLGKTQNVTLTFPPGTSFYGTGEAGGPLLRNGRRVTCWNTDAYGYGASSPSLYQSHPWVLAVLPDGRSVGLLADTTYRCVVDTGATSPEQVKFSADGRSFGIIIIEKAGPGLVLTELARLTGAMPLPPKWAIGYHQCRYSYFPEARVREIAEGFRSHDIPADVIWMDIDYMEAFRVFTFDRGHFPDPGKLNADLLAKGFHNVWMIDPGMKADDVPGPADRTPEALAKDGPVAAAARERELANYRATLQSGHDADIYVKDAGGKTYRGAVWPGPCVFPDYTSPKARAWWANLYGPFLANGISGVWNDMNEPAIFNVASKTMPETNRHAGDPEMKKPDGSPQGEDAAGTHARYHNVYGMQMIRGTREGILAARPDKRPFVLSRANYIGGQRYGATWTGDNTASWEHLEMSIPMSLNVGLSGQPFIGPDIGGFASNGDAKLFSRWMGFGAMLPFARGHTGKENINKEPWAFDEHTTATCREALKRRYRLLPYYYTIFREASVTGLPVARPAFFADPTDQALRSEDDIFLIGADLLVKASVVPDGTRVPVMPKGAWREIEKSDNPDLPGLFVRAGAILPSGPDIQFADEKPLDPLTLIINLDEKGKAAGSLYEDAGDGWGYQKGEYRLTNFVAWRDGDQVTISTAATQGSMPKAARQIKVRILMDGRVVEAEGGSDDPIRVMVN